MRLFNLMLLLFIGFSLPMQSSASLIAPQNSCPAQAVPDNDKHRCCKVTNTKITPTKSVKTCKTDQGCENQVPLLDLTSNIELLASLNSNPTDSLLIPELPLTVNKAWRPPSLI